ncbi:T9SS type A sorting domain-containing protein [Sediminitomix flava]|uniref:Putative secreted protein (Por secretion system target) n=1 Tax=Sediminitomix flava TaxID=379075 RepID=A0A315Z4H1_SEDFL|nr:T9SS type A sorting domain-containing protein [Sediminitomix flava]PWJ37918.1 putative secreted protein (Por secretion system target) [Sediminitomix flava]
MKQLYFSLSFLVMIFFYNSKALIAQDFSGGSGTTNDPYLISNVQDLLDLDTAKTMWGMRKSFKLTEDIDMEGEIFHPLGWRVSASEEYYFMGSFDGDHHTISNLTVTPHPDQDFLFGGFIGAGRDLTVSNLGIVNTNVDFKSIASSQRIGGLIGQLDWNSTVENCFVVDSYVSGKGGVGGLVGKYNGNTIVNCFVDAEIDPEWANHNAGLVGNIQNILANSTITKSAFYGKVLKGKATVGLANANVDEIYCISTTGQTDPNSTVVILTPEELLEQSNYTGLDFSASGLWEMKENSFAVLKGFSATAYDSLLTFLAIPLKVTMSDGTTPIQNATVTINDIEYQTNAAGLLDDLILPGTYSYTVMADGYQDTEGTLVASLAGDITVVSLISESVPVYTSTFNLTNSKGEILNDASITVTDDNVYNQSLVSDESGVATFEQLLPGTYSYTISKDLHITLTDEFEVIDQNLSLDLVVQVDNQAPIANAGLDVTAASGDEVQLDASGSSDANNDALTYTWTAPVGITLSNTNAVKPVFTAPDVQETTEYQFTLVVNDGELDSDETSVTITVKQAIVLGVELLTNGGFESGLSEGWIGLESFELSELIPDSNTNSTNSLKIETTSQIGGGIGTDAEISTATDHHFPITVGKSYILKGKLRAERMNTNVINFRLMPYGYWYDGAKAGITNPSMGWGIPAVIGEWIEFEEKITIDTDYSSDGALGNSYQSILNILSATNASDELVYIDDLSLLEYDVELQADAGDDITVMSDSTVSLSGSYNSSEDLTFSWTAPNGITLSNSNTLNPSFTSPTVTEETNLAFTLTVEKGLLSVEDEVIVTVFPNTIANAGEDQTVLEETTVILDGSATTPENSTLLWTAPSGITLSDNTSSMPTFTAPAVSQDSTITFTLTSTFLESEDSDVVNVTIYPTAIAIAGENQTVIEGSTVTLDGSASTPSNATLLWTAPEGIDLSDNSAAMPTFTAPNTEVDTTLVFTLTATYYDQEVTDQVQITVYPTAVANAGEDQTVIEGSTVTLDASASAPSNATLLWTAPEGINLSDNSAAMPTFTAPSTLSDTTFVFTLTATYYDQDVTDQVQVTVYPTAIANAGEDQTVIEESTVTLDASASAPSNATLLWTAPEGIELSDNSAAMPTFTAPSTLNDTTFVFTLTATYYDQEVSDQIQITVYPTAVANAGEDQTVIEESTVTLDASASAPSNATLLWTAPEGINLSDNSAAMPTFTAPSTLSDTTFIFTLTAIYYDQEVTDQVQITVYPTAVANAGEDQSVIEGSTVTLDASASAPSNATILWSAPEGIELSDNSTAMPTFTAPQVNESTDFTFELTVSYYNQTYSDQVIVTINPEGSAIADAGEDQVVLEGNIVTLNAEGSIPSDANFLWIAPEGISLSSNTSVMPSFTAPNVSEETIYTISLTVSYSNTEDSDEVNITVYPVPIANAGADLTAWANESVRLDASATTPLEATLTWVAPNGITLSDSTVAMPTFTAPNVNQNTDYSFTLKAEFMDSVSTDNVIVTVYPTPNANAGADLTAWANENVTLDASATTPLEATLTWVAPNGITLSDSTVAMPTFTAPNVNQNTDYSFTLKAEFMDSVSTDNVIVTVYPTPNANAGADLTAWANENVTLDASATMPSEATLTWVAPNGITLSDSTVVMPTFTAPNVNQTTDYSFTLKAEFMDSVSTDNVIVTVYPTPNANAGADLTTWANENVTLDASASAPSDATITWIAPNGITLSDSTVAMPTFTAPNVNQTTDYSLMLKAEFMDSVSTDNVIVTVYPTPNANAGADLTAWANENVTLDASATMPSEATLTWVAPNGITLSDSTVAMPTFTAPNVNQTTEYSFMLKAEFMDSVSTDNVIVTVYPTPNANAGTDLTAWANENVTLDASATDPSDASLTWVAPDGITLSDSTVAMPTFTAPNVNQTTEYSFMLKAEFMDSVSTDNVIVTVYPTPNANAGVDQNVIEGTTVTLDASVSTPEGVNVLWIAPNDDITLSNDTTNIATFIAPNVSQTTAFDFILEVHVMDSVSTDTVTITIHPTPIADAGNGKSVFEGETVALDASTSEVNGANIQWLSPEGIQLSDETSLNPTFVAPEVEETEILSFILELSLFGITVQDEVQIIVSPMITNSDKIDLSSTVYPNPTKDRVNIKLQEDSQVVIYHISGRKVEDNLMKKGEHVFDLSQYPTGTYIVSVKGNSIIKNIKLIKE